MAAAKIDPGCRGVRGGRRLDRDVTTDGQTWPAVRDLGDGTATFIANNALVANPAGFNKFQLDDPTLASRSADKVTRVYVPDLHGRIWKFPATSNPWANFGPSQPFGSAMALLKLPDNTKELVFASSGNDPRVPLGLNPPFNAYGFNDLNPADSINGLGTASLDFTQPWQNPTNSSIKYRGTTQPTTGFAVDPNTSSTVGRVFFAGTRYIADLVGTGCASTFDTLIFAFGAATGGAAYDFTNNTNVTTGGAGYATMMGNKTTGIQVVANSFRDQPQNKKQALSVLQAKLEQLEEERREREINAATGGKLQDAGTFGTQIRSYVFYDNRVKDHRTGFESSNVEGVLRGEIQGFVDAELQRKRKLQAQAAAKRA